MLTVERKLCFYPLTQLERRAKTEQTCIDKGVVSAAIDNLRCIFEENENLFGNVDFITLQRLRSTRHLRYLAKNLSSRMLRSRRISSMGLFADVDFRLILTKEER
jgi:hypothetical protein